MNYFDMLDRGRRAALYAYLHGQAQNLGRSAAGGEGFPLQEQPQPTPDPTPDPTPSEPIEYDMTWYLIHNDTTWDEVYNLEDSPLKKYYDAYPEEDRWNEKEDRAVNFNDRQYEGIFNGEEVRCGTTWATSNSQKLELNGVTYYCEIWGYNLDPKTVELFSDSALENPTGQTFEITKVSFSDDCKQCWKGTINAPGAKLPWAVVDVKSQYDLSINDGKIEFQYNGSSYYPFGSEFRKFRGFGIVPLPTTLNIDPIDPKNQEATDTFKETDLIVKGYVKLD